MTKPIARQPAKVRPARIQQPILPPANWTCWHCRTTDPVNPLLCDCIVCGRDTTVGWAAGLCVCCLGRQVQAPLIEKLEHYGIDPRARKHWRFVRHTTGGGHRVFDPVYPGEHE